MAAYSSLARTLRKSSMPLILGMFQSETMKSMLSRLRTSQAVVPSSASTTLVSSSWRRMFLMILRMVEKSSTTRMRMFLS